MAMTIIELGGVEKSDFSILVGKSMLLKFTQQSSLLDNSESLRRFVNSLDLFLNTRKLGLISDLVKISGDIREALTQSIRRQSLLQSLDSEDKERLLEIHKKRFKFLKDSVRENSRKIEKIDSKDKLYLAQNNELYFCKGCDAYLGVIDQMLPASCHLCGEKTVPKAGKSVSSFRFLSDEVYNYLGGIWIQDYIARLLRRVGWRTWTECLIMGASGVNHQIDLLAVNEEKGRVVIGECKTQAVSDHAFKLVTQFSDIQPSFGLLISRYPMNSCDGKSIIEKKPGLKLIELSNKNDDLISELLISYITGDN